MPPELSAGRCSTLPPLLAHDTPRRHVQPQTHFWAAGALLKLSFCANKTSRRNEGWQWNALVNWQQCHCDRTGSCVDAHTCMTAATTDRWCRYNASLKPVKCNIIVTFYYL
jgi:hypothetical protein